MLTNWLTIAFINYKKNGLSTLINLFGLTIGLTGFMLILMHWNDEESYEKWNPKKDQIYAFQSFYKRTNFYGDNISYPLAFNALKTIPEVQDFVIFNGSDIGVKMTTKYTTTFQQGGFTSSESFLTFFPFKIISGRAKDALKSDTSIIISRQAAMKLFGTTNAVGESLKFDDKNYIVTAVYELPEGNSQIKPQFVFKPVEGFKHDKEQWNNFNYGCFFMLKKGAAPANFENKFKDILMLRSSIDARGTGMTTAQFSDLHGPNSVQLIPLDQLKLHAKASWFGAGDFRTIMILFSLSVLIVILSAINFINLKTAEASQRAKEVGVRKAIGGTKLSLMLQFFLETFIICLLSYFLSLALTELLLPAFNQFFNKEIELKDWHIYLYSLTMVIVVTLLSGLIPAFYLSNFKTIETLKGNFSRSKHGVWLRNGILTLQLVISSFFIIGGLIVHTQVKYMMNKDLGFNGNQIMMINFNESTPKAWLKYERLKTEILKINGVEDVSFGESVAGTGRRSSSNMDYEQQSINAENSAMDYNYLQFLDVKLLKGRWLNPHLASDTMNTVIVNEAFVKKFGWTDEQMFQREIKPGFDEGKKYKVVGIVKDFNLRSLKYQVEPIMFFHYKQSSWKRFNVYNIQVKIKADDIEGTVAKLKKFWQTSAEPGYPIDYYFLNQKFAKTFEMYQKQQTLFTILNAMVLMVALLGLFALSSLMIEQKLKDVAIRKTLGASDRILVFGLTRQFLWIAVIAVLISIPISYFLMNEWLKDFAYRIDMPAWPFVISFVLLLVLTFAVVSIKAYKATKVDLVKYLKYE
ncbi:ABC transporter permease [Chryseobacterium indologenes]|uniref:ABC transporter permease n=1 Tax=Chryseobacterium indologenes TaxID=253 RepID=UPI0003E085FD|nr:ABC transporter permease [Chryseobacterium indologenes]ATN04778.1 ABC transporter permease [Chryseobacterium indologenes]AYY86471.1 ABC transporter permease [Chryseobacterium indologenes]QIX83364.1 FtsX-like permease family protein [Chryseobacterium indologenes]UDQ53057.1 ABC transporter permease [Chryseobacterium indologenes]SFJ12476.1 putative ABC transport system permease protein [Chryseobacterium indologenes]